MTALEIIKFWDDASNGNLQHFSGLNRSEAIFLLRAFEVMREMAIEAQSKSGDEFGDRALPQEIGEDDLTAINKEFESRMKSSPPPSGL